MPSAQGRNNSVERESTSTAPKVIPNPSLAQVQKMSSPYRHPASEDIFLDELARGAGENPTFVCTPLSDLREGYLRRAVISACSAATFQPSKKPPRYRTRITAKFLPEGLT
jgi:hypothetical protein